MLHCFVVLPQCDWQLVVLCASLEKHTDLVSFSFLICPSLIHPRPPSISQSICLHMPTSHLRHHNYLHFFLSVFLYMFFFLSCLCLPNLFLSFHLHKTHFIGVPVNSRVSNKIQQLLNTLKRPKRPPLREFFVDDFEELLDGKPTWM